MKNYLRLITLIALMLITALYAMGQAPSASSGSGSGSSGGSSVGASSSVADRGGSVGTVSSSSSVGRDYSGSGGSYSSTGMASYSPGRGGSYLPSYSAPNVNYAATSFCSWDNYMRWQNYYWFMRSYYSLNPGYFGRFTRNREPLATPELVKLTFRRPLKLSLQMLDAVQELEELLNAAQAGKPADKQAIMAKIQEIRELDRQIQKDEGLEYFDQRREKDAFKDLRADKLGVDALPKLREMVTDLSTQLKNSYNQSKPSVVSVQTLSEPSFKSMCKEIDKLTKVIESSARRL